MGDLCKSIANVRKDSAFEHVLKYVGLLYNLWRSGFKPQSCDPEDDDNFG